MPTSDRNNDVGKLVGSRSLVHRGDSVSNGRLCGMSERYLEIILPIARELCLLESDRELSLALTSTTPLRSRTKQPTLKNFATNVVTPSLKKCNMLPESLCCKHPIDEK